jgi:hypothetical protein
MMNTALDHDYIEHLDMESLVILALLAVLIDANTKPEGPPTSVVALLTTISVLTWIQGLPNKKRHSYTLHQSHT